ncbi:MAG TPA: deoxyribodipyrimidine photo-lyase [Alphaproteobacteria bacterium]|nr:deoxyribodipyrimidine photo-lyase [Alphaproteobacteria bacterium]
MKTIVWFRQDLRLADNPALNWAAERGDVVPVYVLDDDTPPPALRMGAASRWWLYHSLAALNASLGGKLVFRRGKAADVIPALAAEVGADAVAFNRAYEEWNIKGDKALKEALGKAGVTVESFNGALLFEPWEIKTKMGGDYKVFTPFWAECERRLPTANIQPTEAPKLNLLGVMGDSLDSLHLLPPKPWADGWLELWTPGEAGAEARLDEFLATGLSNYANGRNVPNAEATTRLSAHLHFGEISPRQVFAALAGQSLIKGGGHNVDTLKRELGWREFCNHLIYTFPKMAIQNWREEFNHYPWQADEEGYDLWQKGQTGYPLVDAGMRELWATGYMHNRVRMVAASFLIKHLRIDWRNGEKWFWDTLVDADLANNACGWQWVAGSGADAAPYFRIFNPVEQGKKFDPDGAYVRKWCPELKDLPDAFIHAPWTAPEHILRQAGVKLGDSYPGPLVDHQQAREAALHGYRKIARQH